MSQPNKTQLFIAFTLSTLILLGTSSCNNESSKTKRTLKKIALQNGSNYKLKEYKITETILTANLEDSIKKINHSILVKIELMKMDSIMLNKYISERKKCETLKRNSRGFSSTYNMLIKDWQKMIDEQTEKLDEKQSEIDNMNKTIEKFELLIRNSNTPIVYYIINHKYMLDKKHIEEDIFLTADFELLQ